MDFCDNYFSVRCNSVLELSKIDNIILNALCWNGFVTPIDESYWIGVLVVGKGSCLPVAIDRGSE